MNIPILNLKTEETIGRAEHMSSGALLVRLDEGQEIPENEIDKHFGLADWEPITFIDGVGCYRKIRAFVIKSWRVDR